MMTEPHYETLDPEDWDAMRTLAHRMVDDALTYLQTVRDRPVWQPPPADLAALFEAPAPHKPAGWETVAVGWPDQRRGAGSDRDISSR